MTQDTDSLIKEIDDLDERLAEAQRELRQAIQPADGHTDYRLVGRLVDKCHTLQTRREYLRRGLVLLLNQETNNETPPSGS